MLELFETLPEIGDPDQPKLVFFFDEAHLLFDEAPKVLVERIELVVRLVVQGRRRVLRDAEPAGHPDSVLAQLGNRVQHALRAFTPRDQKAGDGGDHAPKPGLDIEAAITELAVGEALVSFLDAKGRPSLTERLYVIPPGSQIGIITPEQRKALMAGSVVAASTKRPRTASPPTRSSRAGPPKRRRPAAAARAARPAATTAGVRWAACPTCCSARPPRAASTRALVESFASRPSAPSAVPWAAIAPGVLGILVASGK